MGLKNNYSEEKLKHEYHIIFSKIIRFLNEYYNLEETENNNYLLFKGKNK